MRAFWSLDGAAHSAAAGSTQIALAGAYNETQNGQCMNTSILIVDDNSAMIQVMAGMLKGVAQLRFATRGGDAMEQMARSIPDLVLLDAEMPGMSGYEVCAAMKGDARLANVPVIFVTGHGETESEVRGLEAGAVDFITKPVNAALLLARVRTQLRIKSLTDELRNLATTDGLTGVSNRRHFDELLLREWQRCARSATPLSLLMVDVDHFKRYNDHYGHPAGDSCLKALVQVLLSAGQRPGDLVGRLGGEEFAIMLPETDAAGAQEVAERTVQAVRMLGLPHAASLHADHVTVSVGVATRSAHAQSQAEPVDDEDLWGLVGRADKALYAAKNDGRDCWRAWRPGY